MSSRFVLRKLVSEKQPATILRRLRRTAREDGGALVEMAVTLPVMLAIMTGIFSFSIALYQKLQLAEAVGNGGRYLAVSRGVTDPCQLATNAIYAAAPGLTQSKISLTYTIGSTTSSGASCTGSATSMSSGGTAQIQATYSGCMLNILNMWGGSKVGACTLYSQVTEVVQ